MNPFFRTILLLFALVFTVKAQINSPQNLTAETVKYQIDGFTKVVVSLNWDESLDENSDPLPVYNIYRYEGSSSNPEEFEMLSSVIWRNSFFDNTVNIGETYSYYVSASDSENESGPSNIIEITVSESTESGEIAVVSGNVKDELTEEPLENVSVTFISSSTLAAFSTTTDVEGNYTIDIIPGDYKVYFKSPEGYFPEFYDNIRHIWEANVLTLEADVTYSDINSLLSPIAPETTFNLNGSVLDSEGNPVNAVVHIKNVNQNAFAIHQRNVRTDVDGNFTVGVPEGSQVILYVDPQDNNLSGEFYENAFSVANAVVLTVDDNISGINFVLEANVEGTASISGGVFNSAKEGVNAMLIAMKLGMDRFHKYGNLREFTNDNGNYSINNLPAGDYILFTIPEEGYLPTFYKEDGTMTVNWREADILTLNANSNLDAINFTVLDIPVKPTNGYAEIAGTILSSENQPVVDAYIYIYNQNNELISYSVSDQNGNYYAAGLAPGVYSVSCDNYSFSHEEDSDVVVSLEEQTTVNFKLTSDTPVEVNESIIAPRYQLTQNYPNPFNPSTTIKFSILERSDVKLRVYDILGKEIKLLINEELNPGEYSVQFIGDNLTSGLYFYELSTNKFKQTRKMLLLK